MDKDAQDAIAPSVSLDCSFTVCCMYFLSLLLSITSLLSLCCLSVVSLLPLYCLFSVSLLPLYTVLAPKGLG